MRRFKVYARLVFTVDLEAETIQAACLRVERGDFDTKEEDGIVATWAEEIEDDGELEG